MQNISEDVVIVTGGGSGIGQAIAQRFARQGAVVVILEQDEARGAAAAAELSAEGCRVSFIHCNIASRDDVGKAVSAVVATHGRITVLVNNAGIGMKAHFLDISDETWRSVIDVNLSGAFIVAQEVCRVMAASGGGSVVNMASIAARFAHSDQAGYAVTKAGLEALTRAMAFELAPHNIRVNAVAPGTIATDFVNRMMSDDARRERERRIPSGRLGLPEEVADAVLFLASGAASYINGSVLQIDGGLQIAGIRATS